MWRLIWGNDHLYCGFGARRSHLALHWMSAQGSVRFRCGTITGPYHANFSQVETQKFDPHWFYCLQWGCNNLFCQECIYMACKEPWIDTNQLGISPTRTCLVDVKSIFMWGSVRPMHTGLLWLHYYQSFSFQFASWVIPPNWKVG